MRSRNRVGMVGASSCIRGELCAMYVTSPRSSVDSSIVSTAVYVLCCGSWESAASAPAASDSAVFMGIGAGGGLKGWYLPDKICREKFIVESAGGLSRC